ncbi:DoxX family membrane protein [Sphingobacterium tabacisoli]|uniref:DoxX family membrane protein n=1 Tax=Sphingobacterium tabacisoli TaxID=2044855 RepID=A0ABW5L6U1_9SPHI|nr:DoxX family membrane protein [Sphingobacterium tabacisoli]
MDIQRKIIVCISYIFRAFLAYVYIPHGYEKLTTTIDPQEYIDFGLEGNFLDFYLIWERTGFIWVIGAAQLIGGIFLLFRRTSLFGSIFLLPISVGMFFSHVYISHAMDFLYFDLIILVLNLYLIMEHFKDLRKVFFKPQKYWI